MVARLAADLLADPRHHLVVALDRGVIVGFVSGVHYVHPDKPAQMFINEVGTADSHRAQGVGKAMLGTMLDRARSLGCSEAWVLTDDDNLPARRLYGALGGRPVRAGLMYTFDFAVDGSTA